MNLHTMLLRQVSHSWIQRSRVTSQAFTPTPKDEGRISTYDGDQIDPEGSWRHFTRNLGHQSDGVVAVTKGTCGEFGLPVTPDPETFKEHALIDFRGLSRKEKKDKAQKLTAHANTRGWLFQP